MDAVEGDSEFTGDVARADEAFSLDTQTAEEIKAQTASRRRELELTRIEMERQMADARADMESKRLALEKQFREQERALMERIAPMKAELERLQEMSWTVDLYLGRHEDVTLIQDGKPAPAETPVTIRQEVVAADEESLILGEQGTFDHRDMNTFVEWLTASPDNRDRVLPDQKGVVVVIPTRQQRDYGNIFENAARNAENRRAHWFIRNGDRIYLMVTDDERLSVGDRILPKRNEFVTFFYATTWSGQEPKPLVPGSAEWVKAEETADKVKRHYMRLMLVLQGLIDRTVAFHPLPDGGINLMSVASQDLGTVVLMNEHDHVLSDGREPFRNWQRRLNKELRVGVRVILGNGIGQYGYDHNYRNSRVSPPNASLPPIDEPLMIEAGTATKGFVVRYGRSDTVWRKGWIETKPGWGYYGHDEVTPSKRASARILPSDSWVLPFDLATEADLNYYLNSRAARRDYQSMVPVIRAALRAKATEHDAEAPLRRLLLSTLESEIGDEEQAERELSDVIAWWKVGHRYAHALAGDPETEARASVAIMTEWRKRQSAKPNPKAAEVVIAAAKTIPNALAVAYTRSKKFVVWAKATADEAVYVHEHTLSKTGKIVDTKEWTTPATRVLATMQLLWESQDWATWDKYPDLGAHLTGPERDAIIDLLRQRLAESGASKPIVATECGEGYSRHQSVTLYAWRDGVDISDHQAYLASGGRSGERSDAFIASTGARWKRKNGEVVTSTHDEWWRYGGGRWGRYSTSDRGVSLPYRPGSRKDGDDDIMVWADESELARAKNVLAGHSEKATKEDKAQRSENALVRDAARKRLGGLQEQYLGQLTEKARAEFLVDFGAEAANDAALWEHHLGTLKLDKRIPRISDDVETVLCGLIRAGIGMDGLTVTEALDRYNLEVATEPFTVRDIDTWGDFTITAP